MVTGVGIDLVEIGRLEEALERRPALAKRLFSEAELAYAAVQARPGRHLAARFAAKEATIKALALIDGAPMNQIEVINSDAGITAEGCSASRPLPSGEGSDVAAGPTAVASGATPKVAATSSGPPKLRLSGRAAEAARGLSLHLSLTHTDEHASAVVIAEE